MGKIADYVADLEEQYEELKEANVALSEEVSNFRHENQDLIASLTGATREIDQLFAELEYYRQINPDLKTAWEVRQRMEDDDG